MSLNNSDNKVQEQPLQVAAPAPAMAALPLARIVTSQSRRPSIARSAKSVAVSAISGQTMPATTFNNSSSSKVAAAAPDTAVSSFSYINKENTTTIRESKARAIKSMSSPAPTLITPKLPPKKSNSKTKLHSTKKKSSTKKHKKTSKKQQQLLKTPSPYRSPNQQQYYEKSVPMILGEVSKSLLIKTTQASRLKIVSYIDVKSTSMFILKLFAMVHQCDVECPEICRWTDDGCGFFVNGKHDNIGYIISQYFDHSNFLSFQRQLNNYEFLRQPDGRYCHDLFHCYSDPETLEKLLPYKGRRSPKSGSSSGSRPSTHTPSSTKRLEDVSPVRSIPMSATKLSSSTKPSKSSLSDKRTSAKKAAGSSSRSQSKKSHLLSNEAPGILAGTKPTDIASIKLGSTHLFSTGTHQANKSLKGQQRSKPNSTLPAPTKVKKVPSSVNSSATKNKPIKKRSVRKVTAPTSSKCKSLNDTLRLSNMGRPLQPLSKTSLSSKNRSSLMEGKASMLSHTKRPLHEKVLVSVPSPNKRTKRIISNVDQMEEFTFESPTQRKTEATEVVSYPLEPAMLSTFLETPPFKGHMSFEGHYYQQYDFERQVTPRMSNVHQSFSPIHGTRILFSSAKPVVPSPIVVPTKNGENLFGGNVMETPRSKVKSNGGSPAFHASPFFSLLNMDMELFNEAMRSLDLETL